MIVMLFGGTGTLGANILPNLLANPSITRIRVMSRGEHKQVEMEAKYKGQRVDFFLGDIADPCRVETALRGVNQVYHFAAIKHVHKAQYDPEQAVRTNILGTMNIIRSCINQGVSRAMFTSTDKACDPINSYGATKLLAEHLWVAGNRGKHGCKFAAVRYGNVWSSQGSVIEKWKTSAAPEVTDPDMTRFFISPKKAAAMVYDCMQHLNGGEVFIPKMKSIEIGKLAEMFGPYKVIGRRPGEKMHESLVSPNEHHLVNEWNGYYVKYPEYNLFPVTKMGDPMKGEAFTSQTAERLTPEDLKELLNG